MGKINLDGIYWAIIGGESGFGFRQVKKDWVDNIVNQSRAQNVAVFFKQWGGVRPKSGGRELNGEVLDEYPSIAISERIKSEELSLKKKVERKYLQEQPVIIPTLLKR